MSYYKVTYRSKTNGRTGGTCSELFTNEEKAINHANTLGFSSFDLIYKSEKLYSTDIKIDANYSGALDNFSASISILRNDYVLTRETPEELIDEVKKLTGVEMEYSDIEKNFDFPIFHRFGY